ncbi:MAG: hypothetical protein AAF744_01250 [Pseudomonadota bacterium]
MIESIEKWASDYVGILALLAVVIALLSPIIGKLIGLRQGVSIETQLRDPRSRKHLINRYEDNSAESYFDAITRLLDFARRAVAVLPRLRHLPHARLHLSTDLDHAGLGTIQPLGSRRHRNVSRQLKRV